MAAAGCSSSGSSRLVVVLCSCHYNPFARRVVIRAPSRADRSMDAEIGSFHFCPHFARSSPTDKDSEFHSLQFARLAARRYLYIPEIYVEYDRAALIHR